MKTRSYVIVIAFIGLLLSSCEGEHNNYMPDRYDMVMMIAKIDNPELLQYVVAESIGVYTDTTYDQYGHPVLRSDSDVYHIRLDGGTYQELFLGTNPYIALGEDYYLIDWKWGYFLYEVSEVIMDIKWEDVKDRQQVWPLETPLVLSEFVPEYRYISRKDVDDYLGIMSTAPVDTIFNMSIDYVRPWFIWKFNTMAEFQEVFPDSTNATDVISGSVESYNAEAARQDSLQQVFAERLKQIIQEDDLQDLLGKKRFY